MSTGGGIAALILAAGYGTRLGGLKPLLPLGCTTIIEEAVRRFHAAGVEDIRVVTGHRAGDLAPVLKRLEVREIFNPDYAQGMLASVRAGVGSLEPKIAAFFLLPVDIPLVKPRTIAAIMQAYRQGEAKIVYPSFQGVRGHPPLIALACAAGLPPDWQGGLRDFLSHFDGAALDLEVLDEAVLLDCDTPADYCRLLAYQQREKFPSRRECEALWDQYSLPEKLRRHCRLVGALAGVLAGHLQCAGVQLKIPLAVAAGYLHDLAKGQPEHARTGAGILADLGYGGVARVVAAHTDIQIREQSVGEAELVYLADKFATGDRLVSLRERFSRALEKYGDNPEILRAIAKRCKDSLIIKNRLEEVLEISLEELLRRYEKSLLPAAAAGTRRIYLARHGAIQTPKNPRRYLGHLDVRLSEAGRGQAEALRERLRQVKLAAVYCSDLQRSLETAAIIAAPQGLSPIARREFREIGLGDWEGLTFDEVKARFPEEYAARGRDFRHFRPPGGESFLDLAHRVLPALYETLSAAPGDLLLVGHAGVNRTLLSLAQGRSLADLFDIPQGHGCLNLVTYRGFEFAAEPLDEAIPP